MTALLFGGAVVVQACGARTELPAPDAAGTAGAPGSSSGTGLERVCAPNCAVGHRCCVGGCDGPAAVTLNDCCQCFPGEVNSTACDDHECGG